MTKAGKQERAEWHNGKRGKVRRRYRTKGIEKEKKEKKKKTKKKRKKTEKKMKERKKKRRTGRLK